MLRRFWNKPKPFKSCCWNTTVKVDETEGLKKFSGELEDDRVLSHDAVTVVPVENPCEYCVWYWDVWVIRPVSPDTPVPEMNGLFTGVDTSSKNAEEVSTGSKVSSGTLAVEYGRSAP